MNWWALYRAIGAEHTTVTLLGLENGSTALAVIEPLTSISGHGLGFGMTTFRASDY